ncbi:hypothetical protein ACFY97_02690 [Streptomyces klenkii]|uniref:hypothetical protein n=1 Tax=Streptomyces klenkii TaxID=1420899 RepID=UPI0036E8EF23
MPTSTSQGGKPFGRPAQTSADDSSSTPSLTERRLARRHTNDSLRVSALAYQHLGDEGPALDAAYQMTQCIARLLDAGDFARFRAFAAAAYHPDIPTPDGSSRSWAAQCRIFGAAEEHLGEHPSAELKVAHLMMNCIHTMLTDGELRQFLTFFEAAYGQPDADTTVSQTTARCG